MSGLGWVQIFPLVKSSLKDLNLSAGIESWAVVASSSWSEKTLTMLRMLPDDSKDCESIWVQHKLFNAKLFNIASLDRPPNSRNQSLALIHNDIGNTMKKYKHMQCVKGGDFNLPYFNWLEKEILHGPGKSKCDLFVRFSLS